MNDTSPTAKLASPAPTPLALDCSGWDFWNVDRGVRDLVRLYLDKPAYAHLEQHFARLRTRGAQFRPRVAHARAAARGR